jgi:lipopolysaccharide heptosyltransferase I
MADILFIKTSSLGDLFHHMPALTEARRKLPGTRFAWVVEDVYAPLVRLHRGVDDVVTMAWRRWRHSLHRHVTRAEIFASVRTMRERRYDAIIDTQGLIRSAVIARMARGRTHGYDRNSIREPAASLLYHVRHEIGRDVHVIERNRRLTGLALGYVPEGPPDYGLDRAVAAPGGRYAILVHGTARLSKEWAEENWLALGAALERTGLDIVLLSGTAAETARSERIAAASSRARVERPRSLLEVTHLIAGAALVVGVDTGFTHIAAAFGVPVVAIFSSTDSVQAAPVGAGPVGVAGNRGDPPSVNAVVREVERVLR